MDKDYLDRYNILDYLEKNISKKDSTFANNYILFLIDISKIISQLSGKYNVKDENEQFNEIDKMIKKIQEVNSPLEKESPLDKLWQTHKNNLDKILKEDRIKPLTKYKRILKENLRFINLKTNQKYLKSIFEDFTMLVQENLIIENDIIRGTEKTMCFCSHSNDDKLYTIGLFLYFYQEYRILIYLYWMYDDNSDNGIGLKRHFYEMINVSDYFIFVRSMYSELKIKGNFFDYLSIKQWCAWELGCFYNLNSTGFYINSFDSKSNLDNKLLDDFVLLENINNQLR